MDGRSYRKESVKEKEMICFKNIKYASYGHLCHNVKTCMCGKMCMSYFLFLF